VVEGSAQGAGLAIGQSLALGFQVDDFLDQAGFFLTGSQFSPVVTERAVPEMGLQESFVLI